MANLEGFVPFDFTEGVAYASVTNNGITFNKAAVKKLGCPDFVVLLINSKEKKIAIQKCTENTEKSVAFYKQRKNAVMSVRWNGRDLLNTIQDITDWDLSKEGHRIEGVILKESDALLFDLNKATLLK